MRYYVVNITWETDEASPKLPTEAWVECDDEGEIANALSKSYGWLVADFDMAGTSED